MTQNNEHPIKIANIGESRLVLDLNRGSASNPNHKHLDIPSKSAEVGQYGPDNNRCVGFKIQHFCKHDNPIFKLVIGKGKPAYDLDTVEDSKIFKLKILVDSVPSLDDTNVEVGVDEPPDLPPMDQKQKPEGK
jgi:hypothetical protein